MRYYEITAESTLHEGLLDNIKSVITNKVNDVRDTVTNATTALAVFHMVGTNEEYQETMTYLLKKKIKTQIKMLQGSAAGLIIGHAIARIFPKGRGFLDFIKSVAILGLLESIRIGGEKVVDAIKDGAKGIATNLLSLDRVFSAIGNATGFLQIFETIGVMDRVLFAILTEVNKKITDSAPQA